MKTPLITKVILFVFAAGLVAFIVFSRSEHEQFTNDPIAPMTTVELQPGEAVATLAGGCFWCTESALQETEGVLSAVNGYAGGSFANPTYEQIITQETDFREATQVIYDPEVVSFTDLLDVYFRSIDPTDPGGQFADRGFSYTTAVYFHDETQEDELKKYINDLEQQKKYDSRIVVAQIPFTNFYDAEEYHQDYYLKASDAYKQYEAGSGRAAYILENSD